MIMRLNKNKEHEIIKTDSNVIENEKKNFEENYIRNKKNYKNKDNVFIPKKITKKIILNKNIKIDNEESENKLSSEIKEEEKKMPNHYDSRSKNKTPSKQSKIHNNFFKTPNKLKSGEASINIKSPNNDNINNNINHISNNNNKNKLIYNNEKMDYNPYNKSNVKIKKLNEIKNNSSINIRKSELNKQFKSNHKEHNDNPLKKRKNILHKYKKSDDIIPSTNNKFYQYNSPPPIKGNKLNLEVEKTSKKNNNNEINLTDPAFDNKPNDDFINNYLKKPPGLIGLQNIGATCYMNATLQCFSNVPKFREEFEY